MNITLKEDHARIEALSDALALLKRTKVEVGLPAGASGRSRWLLALHERGAPGAHIPPRPVVGPALAMADTQAAITDALLTACEAAADGDPGGVTAGFEAAGQAGVQGIRDYIDNGIKPGNAPLTVSGGWIRNFSSGQPVRVPGKGFDKPLYDTGALYDSFDFEVKS